MKITIIYLENKILMSKKYYKSWRLIQDEYDDYKTSLKPDSSSGVIDYHNFEYPDLKPSAEEQVKAFISSPNESVEVTFNNEH